MEAIGKALGTNPTAPQGEPKTLDLDQLRTIETVFQPRDLTFREGEHEAHVEVLAKAIGRREKPNYLEPITVWWGGSGWYILDGHHRRLAYARAKVVKNIPVRVFKGGLEEALGESVALNSKNKMAMSLQDKTNAAWRLTARTDYSKSQIARECSVAESSVANMRRIKRELTKQGVAADQMLAMNWGEAQRVARGEERPEINQDSATERRARGYAKSLARALKDRPHKDPEGFAKALLMLDERLPGRLLETEAWTDVRLTYLQDQEDLAETNSDY
ncbi:hypothetical protein CK222_22340 [Mesorhizobium sp. WSM3866]|nr:hypothetical protein CK222_22340 [Mesorhizobium sp. WSM3866]